MAQVTYPCYWMYKDNAGQWRWTYYARNKEAIAVSSESYVRKDDCLHGIRLMQGSGSDLIWESA